MRRLWEGGAIHKVKSQLNRQVFSKDLAAVSAPLTFTPQSCGAWGSPQLSGEGGLMESAAPAVDFMHLFR